MDYGRIFNRSLEITWRYRALWVFGVLLALFGGRSSLNLNFPSSSPNGVNWTFPGGTPPTFRNLPPISQQTIFLIIGVIACVVIVWIVLSIFLRLVSRAALIGGVQELEASGATPTVGRGFRVGVDRFWPLLGIALLINIPLFLISVVIILCAAAPLIVSLLPMLSSAQGRSPDEFLGVFLSGLFSSIILICCASLLIFLMTVVITPFYEFMVRVCVTARRGTMESVLEGYRVARSNLGQVIVLYILVFAIGIGFGLLMIPVALVGFGLVAALGFGVYALANSAAAGVVAGLISAIPVLLVFLFFGGLYQVLESTLWTEGFLALTAPGTLAPAPATAVVS